MLTPASTLAGDLEMWGSRMGNAGVLPAPAGKLAGDPIRCAQNDKQKRIPLGNDKQNGSDGGRANTEILELRSRMTIHTRRQNDDSHRPPE